MLASAPPVEAQIVYTPVQVQLKNRPPGGSTYYLDLNHDGINDFQIGAESAFEGFPRLYTCATVNPLRTYHRRVKDAVEVQAIRQGAQPWH
jgi:hypothetical protein